MNNKLWEEFLKDHGNTVFNNWYELRDFTYTNRIIRSIQNIKDDRVPNLINLFQSGVEKSTTGSITSVQAILQANGFHLDLNRFKDLIINHNHRNWSIMKSKREVCMNLIKPFLPDLPSNFMYNLDVVPTFIHVMKMSIVIRKICWCVLRVHKLETEEDILNIAVPNISNLEKSLKLVSKDFLGTITVKFDKSNFAKQLKADIYNTLSMKLLNMTSYGKKVTQANQDKSRKSYIMLLAFLRLDTDNMYTIMLMALKPDGCLDSKYLIDHLKTRVIACPEVKQKILKFYLEYDD